MEVHAHTHTARKNGSIIFRRGEAGRNVDRKRRHLVFDN